VVQALFPGTQEWGVRALEMELASQISAAFGQRSLHHKSVFKNLPISLQQEPVLPSPVLALLAAPPQPSELAFPSMNWSFVSCNSTVCHRKGEP
jgi:hypothetical protein